MGQAPETNFEEMAAKKEEAKPAEVASEQPKVEGEAEIKPATEEVKPETPAPDEKASA